MKKSLQVLSMAVLTFVTLSMTSRASDDIFSITGFDQAKHLYATIDNEFDSSLVRFQIGEFNLKRANVLTPVLYSKQGFAKEFERGSSATGQDLILSNKYKTSTFIPANGDSIGFYRETMLRTLFCKKAAEGDDPPPSGSIGPYADSWKTVIGGVQDTSIVMIKVEDVSDTTISTTLDSVAIYPNGSCKYVEHGGMNVDGLRHMRAIPNTLWGRTVRIRVNVLRYGSTPLGMSGQFSPENIAFSAYRSRATQTVWSNTQIDSVVARYRELAEDYIRSVASTTNLWSPYMHLVIPDTMFKRIMSDYYTINDDSAWSTYTPIYGHLDTNGIYLEEDETHKVNFAYYAGAINKSSYYTTGSLKNSSARDLQINGAWINAGRNSLLVKCKISKNVKVVHWRVVDLQGKALGEGYVWPTFTKQGVLEIPHRWDAIGPIFLQLLDEQSHQLSSIGIYSTQ